MTLNKRLALVISLAVLAACGDGTNSAPPPETGEPPAGAAPADPPAEEDGESAPDEWSGAAPAGPATSREFAEVGAEDMRPAFTRETVVKLNAIVQRSLDAANEYTSDIRRIRSTVNEAAADDASEEARREAEAAIARLVAWRARAGAARADMDAAVAELRASDEIYNEEILAGMIKYVRDVELALETEIETLSAKMR